MHMADALLAPAVAATMYVASGSAAGVSIVNLRKEEATLKEELKVKLPAMAVMSALVFAGQMVNYTIPGTGSSGHLCGGMMLTGVLGPYAGFLSMIVILAIQCLFFADGGLMALGANVWNMAFYGCFVGYFLIYRPIMQGKLFSAKGGSASVTKSAMRMKIVLASVLGCVLTLQLGALSVVLETSLSGVTELPFGGFLVLMQPIHLAIGLIEGLITAAVLVFVYEARPQLLRDVDTAGAVEGKCSLKTTFVILALVVAVIGGGVSLLASQNPDGLEWSLFGNADEGYSENMGLDEEAYGISSNLADSAASIQEKTAFLPDYAFSKDAENPMGTTVSGLVGSGIVAAFAILTCFIGGYFRKRKLAS